MMEQTEHRFIADCMLGKLARWLRIIGCDTEYFPAIDDAVLVERAERTGRLILTRDTRLVRRRKARANHFFITHDHFRDQLRQVVHAFSLDPFARFLSRCIECNALLSPTDKTAVIGQVPPYVFMTRERFSSCPSCRRVYWEGTQRERMVDELRDILR
jgi:uncharacterized protein